jgi:glycosyltransferase involved in cell wall biosynthesis
VISGNETYLDEEDKKELEMINAKEQRVFFTGFVSNAALAQLFRNSDAFIFPSLSEGFGIPVLEAFYYKKPLLCSNTTSLPEIAGDAALYFDPADTDDIATVIERFYNDDELAEYLLQKGQDRLQFFSWKTTAENTYALYKKILSEQ